MRKVNIVFLVGLCVGALAALVVVVATPQRHVVTALGPAPVAAAGTDRSTAEVRDSPAATTSGTTTGSAAAGTAKTKPAGAGKDNTAQALASLVPDGHVSVVVYDRQDKTTVLSVDADRTYTSASLVKLMIAFQALDNGADPARVTEMLERSDDNTASDLWVTYGWGSIVDNAVRRMGLTGTHPPASPGHWGDTQITADDITKIYRYLVEEAPERDRTIILAALHHPTVHGADGIRQFFGIPDAVGPGNFAVKQGWSCCEPDHSIMLHTSGLVYDDRFIVTVLTQQPAAADYTKASAQLTAVVKNLVPLLKK
ncbi:hypothetical protein [Amycolatopsis sp. NPDC051903]|uniref:hypothetical protein n=1 Tax=Amycolatopsis sp. NPDC051903 TaxID=3363936 RepID=UPI00378B14F9